jgi:hypothetical protein
MWNFIALLVVSIFFRKKSFFLQFYGNLIKKEGFSWSKPLPGGPWKLFFFHRKVVSYWSLHFNETLRVGAGVWKKNFRNFKTRIFSKYFWKLVAKKFRTKNFLRAFQPILKNENFFSKNAKYGPYCMGFKLCSISFRRIS